MFKTKIKEIKEVAENTFYLTIERPENFEFESGQYLNLCLENSENYDSRGSCRIFSIASSENDKENLSFLFRGSLSSFKQELIKSKIGDIISFSESMGNFVIPKKGQHIFIAGGVGVAAFLGAILELSSELKAHLLYANRDNKSSAFSEELESLAKEKENFSFQSIFRRIEKNDLEKFVNNGNIHFWIVGPPGMTDEVRAILIAMNIPENFIKYEEFIGY